MEIKEVQDYIENYKKNLENCGRLLIRKSGTEPLLRVMVECTDENLLKKAVDDISNKIQEYL